MNTVPLRDLFEQLVRDPDLRQELSEDSEAFFAARGHADLDPALVAEAVTNAAATFPPEVAEHFSPYTVAASPRPGTVDDLDTELSTVVDLVATAPAWPDHGDLDQSVGFDEGGDADLGDFGAGAGGDTTDAPLPDVDEPTDSTLETVETVEEIDPDPLDELDAAVPDAPVGELDPMDLDEGTDDADVDVDYLD